MNNTWKITNVDIGKDGETLTVSFKENADHLNQMTMTMPADKWQLTMHLDWLLREEKRFNQEMLKRLRN